MPVTRQKAASDAKFTYSPLDGAVASSFRIVTIFPGQHNTPLSGTLSHEDWRDSSSSSSYEAISYFWGDRSNANTINIDGKRLQITANLESALRHLRHEEQSRHRRLWVDAICINQADNHERSQQVRQMFHIYNRAEQVIVWLGDATADSKKALNLIKASLGPCLESVGFSCTDEQANVVSGFWEKWDEGKDSECLGAINHLISRRHARGWTSVARLLCRPWWRRAWTVQELISAQKVTVLCGAFSMPWPVVDMTIQMMLRNTMIEDLYGVRNWDLFHNAVEDAFGFAYERSHRILDGTESLDFVMLVQITRYRGCQDPRDKVFSILSLLTEDFQASFDLNYLAPISTVYAGAVRSYVQHAGDLHVLSSCCFSKQASDVNLPTWVPDWTRGFAMSFLGGYSATESDYSFCAAGNSSAIASFSEDLRTLTVCGLDIDTVQNNRLQDTKQDFDYQYDETADLHHPWCSWDIHKIVNKLEQGGRGAIKCSTGATVLESVFSTLIVDRNPIQNKRRQKLNLTKNNNRIWPEPLNDYLEQVRLWTQERSLIISASGYIGLAPSSTLPGDKICVLYGFHAAVVLRPNADKSYLLIGDAYMHSLMDGEAVSNERSTHFVETQFVIR